MAFAWDYLINRAARPIIANHLADLARLDGLDAITHAQRVATGAGQCAVALCLSTQEIEDAILTGLCHEIGRSVLLNLPEDVGQTVSEQALYLAGARLLAPLPQLAEVAKMIGTLYQPWREMPIAANIVRVVDAYDARCHPRSSRDHLSNLTAEEWLSAGSGERYDPEIVQLWLELVQPSSSTSTRSA